jgi:hypothetical protein
MVAAIPHFRPQDMGLRSYETHGMSLLSHSDVGILSCLMREPEVSTRAILFHFLPKKSRDSKTSRYDFAVLKC